MNNIKRPGRSHSILSPAILIVLTLTILLGLPDQAFGQGQWTTNGNDISNTNTGNVGVGTTTPNDLLEVKRSQNGGTLIRVDNPDGISPSAFSGITFYQNGVRRAHVVSVNDGCSGCIGGAGAMQLYNFANTHMIFGTNNAERMRITNTGNVGIGTTSPSYRLHIAGDNTAGGGYPLIKLQNTQAGGHSYWLYSGANGIAGDFGIYDENTSSFGFYLKSTGNVGIGTTSPSGQLEVKSAANTHNALYLNTTTQGYADTIVFQDAGTIKASIQHNPSLLPGALLFNTNGGSSPANTSMIINAAGYVGVGTTTPSYRLDVQGGQFNASGGLCIAGDCKTSWSQVGGGSQWTTSGANIYYNSGNVGIGTSSPNSRLHVSGSGNQGFTLQSTTAAAETDFISNATGGGSWGIGTGWATAGVGKLYVYDNNAGATRFLIDTNGNVGIGNTNPSDKLDVAGNIRMSSGYFLSAVGGNLKLNADSANDVEFYQNGVVKAGIYDGAVGIGTTTPGNLLQLNSGVAPTTGQFRISANNAGSLSGIAYSPNNVALGFDVDYTNGSWIARDASVAWLYKTSSKFFIQGSTGNTVGGGTAANSYLAVDLSNGNVGIGTASPTTKLHVAGDITVTGNIAAKYQDVAEWVPAAHTLPAGTVVVLNPKESNQVIASARSYDTRVAGVISERPGLALGEAGPDKVLVATTGRVKVKVDATRAPINVGDLLVTSDKEGVAMKSVPVNLSGIEFHRPGTLIGKALEPLEKGTGEILVLLSLQ